MFNFSSEPTDLLCPEFVEVLHTLSQGLDGLFEAIAADDVLQEFQHSVFVLWLRFGLHHGNLLHLTLSDKAGSDITSQQWKNRVMVWMKAPLQGLYFFVKSQSIVTITAWNLWMEEFLRVTVVFC